MKICTKCKETKDLTEFYNTKQTKSGKTSKCISCYREYGVQYRAKNPKYWKHSTKWRKENPEKWKKWWDVYYSRNKEKIARYRTEYNLGLHGLTIEDYEELKREQNNCCAICRLPENQSGGKHNKLLVDHNHKTGRIRGLLCDRCNRAAGFVRDSPTIAEALSKYLREVDRCG